MKRYLLALPVPEAAVLPPAIRTVLSRAARAAVKRGERPRKKTAITLPVLEAMLANCDDSLEEIRDRALLCFGFASGGRRRSEIAAADLRDLRRIPLSPSRSFLVFVVRFQSTPCRHFQYRKIPAAS
jgi:integrase